MKSKLIDTVLIALLIAGAAGLRLASAQPERIVKRIPELSSAQKADSLAVRERSIPDSVENHDGPVADGPVDGVTNRALPVVESEPRISESLAFSEFTDLPSFTAAAGASLSNITFQEFPVGTVLTTQYLAVGVEFSDGNDTVMSSGYFVTDGLGIEGNGRVHIELARPAVAIGADFPGALTIELYDQPGGALLYTSSDFAGHGVGFFGGVISDTPFTYVVFRDWIDDLVYLDNIHIRLLQTRYVKQSGDMDCTSWANACSLQHALEAIPGDEIWVAEGIYRPGPAGDPGASFQLPAGVGVYGGFAGDETAREQRDWEQNTTILSGDIDENDVTDGGVITDTGKIQGSNAYHVLVSQWVTETAVLDGFTITGGQANGAAEGQRWGGGMWNLESNPGLANLIFSGNWAAWYGGGLENYPNSNPTLTSIVFVANGAGIDSGGMDNWTNSNPSLVDVSFIRNTAGGSGGGMCNYDSSPTLTSVTFSGNSAASGGGICNSNSSPELVNVDFSSNSAAYGGGMYNYTSSPTLTSVDFSDNAAEYGGGLFLEGNYGLTTMVNVIFRGNWASLDGGAIEARVPLEMKNVTLANNQAGGHGGGLNVNNPPPTGLPVPDLIFNSIFWGNSAAEGSQIHTTDPLGLVLDHVLLEGGCPVGAGLCNEILVDDPLFVDGDGPDGVPGTGDDDLRLQEASPARDSGDDALVPPDSLDLDGDGDTSEPVPFDILGLRRFYGDAVDMGACEWQQFFTYLPAIVK